MKMLAPLFRDAIGARLCPHGSVVCIGAFDGLHLGHQALLSEALQRARALNVAAVALSFEPLPREFFAKQAAPARLMQLREKLLGLWRAGMDGVGLLRFDARFAQLSAQQFIEAVLVQRLNVREVWVGEDFRFGYQRKGDVALLQQQGAQLGFSAHCIAPVLDAGERISSTRIRALLRAGNFAAAQRLLGAPYRINGRVVPGQQLGRNLGFPTANLRLGGKMPALSGVFAAIVHGASDMPQPAVVSIGTRPTVDGIEPLLEAHLFDFSATLYGRRIAVECVAHLRDEEKFANLGALVAQMHADAAQARALLAPLFPSFVV